MSEDHRSCDKVMADFSSSSSLFMTDALNADICLTMVFSSIFILTLFSRLFCTTV
jgi:hypothetical protein